MTIYLFASHIPIFYPHIHLDSEIYNEMEGI